MSAPAYAPPSIQQNSESASEQKIAELAYSLWQERGSPFGSPETDWFEAERQLLGAR